MQTCRTDLLLGLMINTFFSAQPLPIYIGVGFLSDLANTSTIVVVFCYRLYECIITYVNVPGRSGASGYHFTLLALSWC